MKSRSLGRVIAGSALAVVVFAGRASGQPSTPSLAGTTAKAPEAPAVVNVTAAKAAATAHFKRGNEHFDKQEWREALGEFRQALELTRTAALVVAAASCLRQLGQYDEALDQYERVRKEFPVLSPKLESKVAPAIAELQGLVGTVVVAGDAPAGASLFIDDRLRGKLPFSEPLRVGVGSHSVRVEKEGFAPITGTVEVKPREQSVSQLVAKLRQGRLVVREKHNWALNVEVDGKDVGVTQWEGMVEPGDHQVRVHGFVNLDALTRCEGPEVGPGDKREPASSGAKVGSQTEIVTVGLYEVRPVPLGAEELDASLRIESTPSGAALRINSKKMGRTPWEGRLPLGTHNVVVIAEGFLVAGQRVRLERRRQRDIHLVLEREPTRESTTDEWRTARNVGAAVSYGVGALGFGVFGVTGFMAAEEIRKIKLRCGGIHCPAVEQENLNKARELSTISTIGLVVGGAGAAVGTVFLFALRPSGGQQRASVALGGPPQISGAAWSASVGMGRFAIEGRF